MLLAATPGTRSKQKLVRHFKEVHFPPRNTSRPRSPCATCWQAPQITASQEKEQGRRSRWIVELGCSRWWENPDSSGRGGRAGTPSCAGQLATGTAHARRAYALPRLRCALQCAGSIWCSHETPQKPYFFWDLCRFWPIPCRPHDHPCVVCFVLVLQGLRAYFLRLDRLWSGASLFPFSKFSL